MNFLKNSFSKNSQQQQPQPKINVEFKKCNKDILGIKTGLCNSLSENIIDALFNIGDTGQISENEYNILVVNISDYKNTIIKNLRSCIECKNIPEFIFLDFLENEILNINNYTRINDIQGNPNIFKFKLLYKSYLRINLEGIKLIFSKDENFGDGGKDDFSSKNKILKKLCENNEIKNNKNYNNICTEKQFDLNQIETHIEKLETEISGVPDYFKPQAPPPPPAQVSAPAPAQVSAPVSAPAPAQVSAPVSAEKAQSSQTDKNKKVETINEEEPCNINDIKDIININENSINYLKFIIHILECYIECFSAIDKSKEDIIKYIIANNDIKKFFHLNCKKNTPNSNNIKILIIIFYLDKIKNYNKNPENNQNNNDDIVSCIDSLNKNETINELVKKLTIFHIYINECVSKYKNNVTTIGGIKNIEDIKKYLNENEKMKQNFETNFDECDDNKNDIIKFIFNYYIEEDKNKIEEILKKY